MDNSDFVAGHHTLDACCIGFHSLRAGYSIDCAGGRCMEDRHCYTCYNCVIAGELASVGSNCLKYLKEALGSSLQ